MIKNMSSPKTPKYPNLDIYFHMTNHYRKLSNVKSVVDTSLPKGNRGHRGRTQLRSQSLTPTKQNCHSETVGQGTNFKNCIESPAARSSSLPPRPPTRRSVYDMPEEIGLAPRSMPKTTQSQTKLSKTEKRPSRNSSIQSQLTKDKPIVIKDGTLTTPQNFSVPKNDAQKSSPLAENSAIPPKIEPPVPAPRQKITENTEKAFPIENIQDHEYLQFSLRITEDIIRNDLYTNREMKRVFNSHVEANRGRLDMRKMKEQIEKLCKELNIPLDASADTASPSREDLKRTRQNLQSSLICICGPKRCDRKTKDCQCECNDTRCLPLQCVQHPPLNTEIKMDIPQLMDITSLECVTEVTEPSSSLATVTSMSLENEYGCAKPENNEQDKKGPPASVGLPCSKECSETISQKLVASELQNKCNSSEVKQNDDSQKKVKSFKSEYPQQQRTPAESTTEEKPKMMIVDNDDEYILVTGPIYIPKSLLEFSARSEEIPYINTSLTYSTLHNRTDNIKHPPSYISNYPGDDSDVRKGQNGFILDSDAFKNLPKVLQLRDAHAAARNDGCSSDAGSVLLHQTDYDETPQRDFEYNPEKKANSKPAETAVSTDVIPIKQEIGVKPNESPVPITTPKSDHSDVKWKQPKAIESFIKDERPKQDLLLGDDYKLSPADEPYNSCLPYPLSLFYLSVATQTNQSDFVSATKLWSMRATALKAPPPVTQSKVTKSKPQTPPPKVTEPTPTSVVGKETASPGSSSGTSRSNAQTDAVLSIFSSNRSSEKSEATLLDSIKENKKTDTASSSPIDSVKTVSDVSRKESSKEDDSSYSLSDNKQNLKEDDVSDSFSNHKGSLKDDDKSDSFTGTYNTYNTYSFNSAEDIKLETEDRADQSLKSVESVKKLETISIERLLEKLDKKQSSSPTNSQKVYVEQVVQDLDKYRRPENEPLDRRQSLKQMATAIENTTIASKIDTDNHIVSEPKVAISLHHPSIIPAASTTHVESDIEGPSWCGLRRKKRKKKEISSPTGSIDINTFLDNKALERNGTMDTNAKKSIRFDNPTIPPAVYDYFQSQIGSVISDSSTITQVSKPVDSLDSSQM